MPTYQYACTSCGHQLEAVQSFSDDPLTECPECTGRLRKLFSSVGIVFKGSGFYRTDSRQGAKTDATAAAANGSAKSDSGATTGKSDSPAGGAKDSTSGSSAATKSDSAKTPAATTAS